MLYARTKTLAVSQVGLLAVLMGVVYAISGANKGKGLVITNPFFHNNTLAVLFQLRAVLMVVIT